MFAQIAHQDLDVLGQQRHRGDLQEMAGAVAGAGAVAHVHADGAGTVGTKGLVGFSMATPAAHGCSPS